jgi:hypothetical protein
MEYFELAHGKIYGEKLDCKNFESSRCYLLRVNILNNSPEYRNWFMIHHFMDYFGTT